MLDYKCAERGVELVRVPPQYLVRRAGVRRGGADNRKTQAQFRCVACGHGKNADVNAARNILNAALKAPVPGARGETEAIGSEVPCKAQNAGAIATDGPA